MSHCFALPALYLFGIKGEAGMNTLRTLHFATALVLISGTAATAETIVDRYIAEARSRWKIQECNFNHRTLSCKGHRFVAKKPVGRSLSETSDRKWLPASAENEASLERSADSTTSPIGEWIVGNGDRRIRIGNCGTALCGTIVRAEPPGITDLNNADVARRSQPLIGLPMLIDMIPRETNRWEGQIYNTRDGKTYSATISLTNPNLLRVEGRAPDGLLLQNWIKSGRDDSSAALTN
jgi:uncharacterized protein (DUF2147 family)